MSILSIILGYCAIVFAVLTVGAVAIQIKRSVLEFRQGYSEESVERFSRA